MGRTTHLILFSIAGLVAVGSLLAFAPSLRPPVLDRMELPFMASPEPSIEPVTFVEEPPFTARFSIYTRSTLRTFDAAMYRHQSEAVYIGDGDAGIITVAKSGATWGDFFSTLPFSLTNECLITGTGQRFCNTENERLRFLLNSQELPGALQRTIQPDDQLIIRYE